MDVPLIAGLRDDGAADLEAADRVARAWLAGAVVGLPTETVYGLSAEAQDAGAVARIYRAKGRPADHPLIVHVQGPQALAGWSAQPNRAAALLADAFWPGALTVVVARSDRASDVITGGQDTVALRCPDHPVALACLRALAALSGDPARGVAAPSANRFGRVSPTRAADVLAEVGAHLDPELDLVVDGGQCAIGVESTIVDCTAVPPRVLRLGAISQEQIDAALAGDATREAGKVAPADASLATSAEAGDMERDVVIRAPGTLEAHYAPNARVLLVEADAGDLEDPQAPVLLLAAGGGVERVGLLAVAEVPTPEGWTRLLSPTTSQEYAHGLYAALRRADELGLAAVVAVLPADSEGPLGAAVRDRLARAAHRA